MSTDPATTAAVETHTAEPWRYEPDEFLYAGDEENGVGSIVAPDTSGKNEGHDWLLCLMYGGLSQGSVEANARRIVACVNACASMSIEDLETIAADTKKRESFAHLVVAACTDPEM